jgi:DNase/tRNase domain of colicin-like bacteriocin
MSLKINSILPKQHETVDKKLTIKSKIADKVKQTDQAIKHLAVKFSDNDDVGKKVKPAKSEVYTPKATIIKLKDGQKELSHQDLSYRLVRETLLRNNIKPSRIEMEEIMALPQNQKIDMNGYFGKNWKFHNLPGIMPSPGKYKDINGKEAFGYKMTLSPKWQADIIKDYKQVKGELAKPENVDKKAVLDMDMKERLKETLKIAWDKGYISDEVKSQVGSITALEAIVTAGVGGGLGLLASTELGAAVLGPAGIVLGTAYFAKKTMEFAQVAEDAGEAKSRNGLDKSAKGMGQLIGSLARDGVLTAIGVAGGFAATKGMPPLERAVSNKTNQVKEALTPQPEGITPEGFRVKVPKNQEVKGSNVLESRANGFPNQRIPGKDGSWDGKVGESDWLSTKPEVIRVTNGEAVPFKNGFPIFDKWKVGEVKLPKMKGNHKSDFSKADELFAQKQGWYKPNGKIDAQRVKTLRDTQKLTWHHHEDMTTMQLVPADLNNNISHTGGASFVKRK